MIAITVDVDWAPDPVIEDTAQLIESHGVKATFFATHRSSAIRQLENSGHEIAIHPNFNPLLEGAQTNKSARSIVEELMEIYPESRGVRSHSMLQSTKILQIFSNCGLVYESNQFLPYAKCVEPSVLWNRLVRIPYNWEDDMHWEYHKAFDDPGIPLNNCDLTVMDFHPVHVFLNSESEARYSIAKSHYHDHRRLVDHRNNTSTPGTRDLLCKILNFISSENLRTATMSEIAEKELRI